MKRKLLNKTHLILFSAFILAIALMPVKVLAARGSYLYSLSNFDGIAPFNWVRMHIDDATGEVYVADPATQSIVIFNNVGMQIYDFDTSEFGRVMDFAVDNEGNFLILTSQYGSAATLTKCNYRGEFVSRTEFKGIPPGIASNFSPNRFFYKNNRFYLASDGAMKVVVTDINGIFESSYDLKSMLKLDEKTLQSSTGIFGLTVDNAGRILFTIPSAFSVYIVSPDGTWTSFGQHGSTPGKFNIVSGIAEDDKGNIYVTDKLKCAVMVFDRNYNFKTEFGYRGSAKDNLVVPDDLAVDKSGKVYVSQSRNRGVSVFHVDID
ncbi:MAG: hypothetical protein ACLQF0_04195 [Dissulfurispiraceae bacterium]